MDSVLEAFEAEAPDFVVEGGEDEPFEIELGEEQRVIRTESADPEIEGLYRRWQSGKLILQPDFQRQYVWDRKKASRLIESALLSVPLPIIYLAEESENHKSVIDGQQRLTAFFSFLDGKFPNGDAFRLFGLKVFPELNGKTFAELEDRFQDTLRECNIRIITILRDSDPDLKFEIFERLNTGATPLNDMELRNCIYRGPYMALLKRLASESEFLEILGFAKPDKRMRDVEYVLRFAAFHHATYLRYKSPMRSFFNRDMERYKSISDGDAASLEKAFKNAYQICKSLFAETAFRRFYRGTDEEPNGSWEAKRFNVSLYDVLMGVFCDKDKNQVYGALDSLREGLIDLMATNQDFIDAILLGTSQPNRVRKRFDMVRQLVDGILESHPVQPRCFSLSLKQGLYEADPTMCYLWSENPGHRRCCGGSHRAILARRPDNTGERSSHPSILQLGSTEKRLMLTIEAARRSRGEVPKQHCLRTRARRTGPSCTVSRADNLSRSGGHHGPATNRKPHGQ